MFRAFDDVAQPVKSTALPASTQQIHRALRNTFHDVLQDVLQDVLHDKFHEPMRVPTPSLDVIAAACVHSN